VKFDWTWELLFVVKLFSEELRKQFVDSNVCEESIVLLQERPLVLERLEFSLKFVASNHLCDLRNFKVLYLVFKCSLGVFNEHT